MTKVAISETLKVDIDAAKKAIQGLESPKARRERERVKNFAALYPDIRDKLKADVSKSVIVKTLMEHGVSISNSSFDELLADEARRQGDLLPRTCESGDDTPAIQTGDAVRVEAKGKVSG
jgi:hypothetical protein